MVSSTIWCHFSKISPAKCFELSAECVVDFCRDSSILFCNLLILEASAGPKSIQNHPEFNSSTVNRTVGKHHKRCIMRGRGPIKRGAYLAL